MSKNVKWISRAGWILFILFFVYSGSPLCELERAFSTCSPYPPSDEPCDTWIATNYAGLDNGPFTDLQCRLLGTASNYCLGAAIGAWAFAFGLRILKRLRQ
jgi:hypothetical protein